MSRRCTRFIRDELTSCCRGRARKSASSTAVRSSRRNAAELMGVDNVDGALVGGASLTADDFMAIAGVYGSQTRGIAKILTGHSMRCLALGIGLRRRKNAPPDAFSAACLLGNHMQTVLIVIHLMVVVALIVTVLLQRSEGGALGIGGGGAAFFTGRGQANVLTRATAILGRPVLRHQPRPDHAGQLTARTKSCSRTAPPLVPPARPPQGDGLFDQLKKLDQTPKARPAAPARRPRRRRARSKRR